MLIWIMSATFSLATALLPMHDCTQLVSLSGFRLLASLLTIHDLASGLQARRGEDRHECLCTAGFEWATKKGSADGDELSLK